MSAHRWVARHVRERWFLVALAAVLVVGVQWHKPLESTADAIPRDWLIASIMLATSAPLALTRKLTGKHPVRAVLLGVLISAGVAPLAAWVASHLLQGSLAVGLLIVGIAPCTLASAAVWTRRGGGNTAVALMVTLITNFGCFLVMPFWVWVLFDKSSGVEAPNLLSRLLLVVVAPLLLGQLLRRNKTVRYQIDKHRMALSVYALCGVLTMVFIGSVRAGELLADPTIQIRWLDGLVLVVVAALLHTVLFALGWRTGCAVAPKSEALATAVAGSQKTLTVGLDVALGFGGLAILPMLVYHVLQLIIDEVLIERLGPGEEEHRTSSGVETQPLESP